MDQIAAEIIEFYRPEENEKNLYISNIPAKFEEQEIRDILNGLFAPHGLLYEIQVKEALTFRDPADASLAVLPPGEQNYKQYYAFVKFYSALAAAKAKARVAGKLFLKGQHLKVQFSRRKKPATERHPLYVTKCYELANFYLGYNGWSCRIVRMREVETGLTAPATNVVKMLCVVELTLPHQGLNTQGVAVSDSIPWNAADPTTRAVATCRAKKQSHQVAVEDAFSKIVLVVLASGKVHAEVNTTTEEQIKFEEQLGEQSVLKVNEIDISPASDEEEDGQQQQQNPENLDDVNRQILEDLANDSF